MPSFYPENDQILPSDDELRSLHKIASLSGAGSGGLGGSGGTGTQMVFIARNPAAPDDPTKPALNYPSGGGPMTQWDVASQAWV